MHALCKLPFGKATLTSKKGRLTSDALKRLREAWSSAIAAYLDEVSMVPGDQLLHVDVRIRQGKAGSRSDVDARRVRFGGLAMNLTGDFLQLPPVDKTGTRKSLAVPIDDVGDWEEPDAAGAASGSDELLVAPPGSRGTIL